MKKYLYLLILIAVPILLYTLYSILYTLPPPFPPNTTIVPAQGDYAYENKTNSFQTQFKASATDTNSIVFENNLGEISFYTPAGQSFGDINSNTAPVADGSSLTYPAIFPGIDLKYTITSSRLLEEFIVQDAMVASQIVRIEQRAQTKSIYVENDDGSFTFYKKNKEVFTLPHPVMYETGNPGVKSEGIIYEIKPDADQLIITKVITEEGQAWLADPKRAYPVAIDLVIDNADSLTALNTVIDNGDTSGNWTSSDATNTTVSQETTIKQEGSGSVKTQTTAGGGTNTGTGIDGACIVNNGTKYLDANAGSSVCNGSARSTAYAVNFSVTGNTAAGSTSVTVSTTPTGLVAGDEFLIINLQGTSGDNSNVGKYETHTVSSISTNTINFTDSPLTNTYNGTTQKIMVQRVPNFSSVTVCGGNTGGGCTAAATLNATAWNGAKNGVLFFRSTGAVIVNSGGTITTSQAGFRGGTSGSNGPETLIGNTSTGGGTGATGTASYGGNGGTQSQSGGNTGGNGATASVAGGTGIGGGGGGGQYTGYSYSASGGGGSYVVSSPITNDDQRLILGNGSSQGAGGGGGVWSPSTGGAANGAGGSTNGSAGASGNPGGGIISIFSNSLTTNSANSLIANGGNGGIGGAGGSGGHPGTGGGGQGGQGGNGGTIALTSNSISLATESTKSIGGNGGTGGNGGANASAGGTGGSGATYSTGNETGGNGTSGSFDGNGARGGGGRGGNAGYYGKININYSSSLSGTTSPTYNAYVVAGASLNDTVTRTVSATDLSAATSLTYWVRSSVAGSYATFGFGESAATEQTNTITINQANTWEQKTWDISGIAAASRNAVTKYAFTFTGDTSGASFYFDDIQAVDPSNTWVSSDATNTTVSLETTIKQEGSGSVKVQTTAGVSNTGTGADGAITVSSDTSINTTNKISARSCADGGDAVNYSVSSLTSTTATLESTPSSGCLTAGDEVLLINLRGTASAFSNTGNYETLTISSISTNVITFTTAKTKYYGAGASDDTNIGLASTNQVVMLQRVPNYTNVTIQTAGTDFYPDEYVKPTGSANNGGGEGGVMFFRANGTVSIAASTTINANGRGYIGGTAAASYQNSSGGGESFCTNGGGNGAGYNSGGGNATCGGGGGAGAYELNGPYAGGTGSASYGGAGGGGGSAYGTGVGYAGGGGGGGYGAFGLGGAGGVGGSNGGTNSSGNGGANTSWNNAGSYWSFGGGGGGGGTYGVVDLSKLYFGSAAGGGGGGYYFAGGAGGNGADGGGIVYIGGATITMSGNIQSNGGTGVAATNGCCGGGGGGGAGGSIMLDGNSLTLGSSLVTATGGAGGIGAGGGSPYTGRAGGVGRIAVSATSVSGTTSPTYTANSVVSGSLNDTVTRSTAATDLSGVANITYWVRSSVAGSYATFGFGEAAATEQTNTITINQANTWEQKTWDVSFITGTARDAVTKFAFTFTGDTSGASFYFDDIQTNNNPPTTPPAPTVNTRATTSVNVIPSYGTNSSITELAIYMEENSLTCDGTGGVYLADNGTSNGATAVWQASSVWGSSDNGTVTVTGLSSEKAYVFCVKARNGNGTESAFSAVGSYNAGYIPLSGDFLCTSETASTSAMTNRYVDGGNADRYVIALDSGTGATNSAKLKVQSCLMTVNNTDTLVVGSIELSGGSIAIATGGQIKIGQPVWAIDADGDGYTADTKLYVGAQPTNGVRKSAITTLATADCGDSTYATNNVCCTVATRYQDADGDGYGNPSVSISACPTAGYVDNNTDCYDSNANAKPGSTYCGTTNRGDGSYDYNCSGGNSACGTTRNYVYSGQVGVWAESAPGENGECGARNSACVPPGYWNVYVPASIGCGQAGYAGCAVWSTGITGCNYQPGECAYPSTSTVCTSPGAYGTQACQ